MKFTLLLSVLLLLAACASSPLKLDGVNRKVTPPMVNAEHPYLHTQVVWGGMIIKTQPKQQTTQIEVLAYPVDSTGEPHRRSTSLGRFLIVHPGFLEPADFAPGRWLSVVGTISEAQTGYVGKSTYRFPVIQAKQLYLWPINSGYYSQPQFHFGIGVQF